MQLEKESEPAGADENDRRWLKRCGLLAGGLIIGFLWVIVERNLGDRALNSAKAELVARGELLTFADFRRLLHTTNAPVFNEYSNLLLSVAGVYQSPRRFWRSLTGRKYVWSQVTNWPAQSGTGWVDDVWTVIPGSVESNRGLLTRAAELATNDFVVAELPFDSRHFRAFGRLVKGYADLQALAFLGTLYDLREGRFAEALANQLQALQLTHATRRDPSLIHFIRLDRISTVAEGAWELLHHDVWSDAQLAALQAAWEAIELIQPMADEMRVGRVQNMDWWRKAYADPRQLHTYTTGGGGSLVSGVGRKIGKLFGGHGRVSEVVESVRALWWPIVPAQHDAAFFLRMWQTNILALEAMDRARSPLAAAGWCPTNVPSTYLFSKWMSRGVRDWMPLIQRGEAIRTIVITAIAIKRYRRLHGTVPVTLKDLVPDLLPVEPIDWFDGLPLRYKPMPDGEYLLYSIGDDLIDDRGSVVNRSKFWGKDKDIVWPMPATGQETDNRRMDLLYEKNKSAKP